MLKRYEVYITLKNGERVRFDSVNPLELKPVKSNGAEMVITKEGYVIELIQVENIEVAGIGKSLLQRKNR